MSSPSNMRAVVVQNDKTVSVEELPTPHPGDNEILVKIVAVALNPVDWKSVVAVPTAPGNILGCDFSGIVVKVGDSPRGKVHVGDHVAGFVHSAKHKDQGAFATYIKVDSDLVWVVPPGTLSHEEAATMGCGLWTAVHFMFHPAHLALTEPPARTTSAEWFFVNGGSTSVGMFAIQLARLAGYKVVTVASPHNHALLKSLGADLAFDYKLPDIVSEIRKATDNKIPTAIDAVGDEASQLFTINVIGTSGGKVLTSLPVAEAVKGSRQDVEIKFTVLYTVLGRSFDLFGFHFPQLPQDRSHMVNALTKFPQWVKDGSVKPNKIKLWDGGLDDIKDGLQYMKDGKVSGEKIVYRI